ncbi:MAG: TIGR02757 family protein [Chitinispirillaceae bacterium]|nr:TIGR02757 family protein [Chitinispirillaceae bacterium]
MNRSELKTFLEEQYLAFHRPKYLCLDPLVCLQGYTSKPDLEIAALTAAMLAYGRAETIIDNVSDLLARMTSSPAYFAQQVSLEEKKTLFSGFRHRFNTGTEIAAVLHAAGGVQKRYGSLEALFMKGMNPDHDTIAEALDRFTARLKTSATTCAPGREAEIGFLLSSPRSGSACKRMNMFLRWMVRPNDGIDLGVWKRIRPSKLILPLDTHVARMALALGLTRRQTATWAMAEEITGVLRRINPFDPVKYDFSLCRSGMVGYRRRAA